MSTDVAREALVIDAPRSARAPDRARSGHSSDPSRCENPALSPGLAWQPEQSNSSRSTTARSFAVVLRMITSVLMGLAARPVGGGTWYPAPSVVHARPERLAVQGGRRPSHSDASAASALDREAGRAKPRAGMPRPQGVDQRFLGPRGPERKRQRQRNAAGCPGSPRRDSTIQLAFRIRRQRRNDP